MAVNIASLKIKSFVYDFAVDGGAISTIQMGVFIPINAVIQLGHAKVITACTSGGAATISVGWTGATTALLNAGAVATFTAGAVLPGVTLATTPVVASAERQLAVTIAVDTLLTGKFVYTAYYIEYNQ